MKAIRLFIRVTSWLLLFFSISVNAQTSSKPKTVLPIQYWQTSQGTPVYFVRASELPMMDIKIIFNAGSAYDDNLWGLASFTSSLLNEGTKEHNADQIANLFDQVGAQFDVDTNRDFTEISLRTLSDPKYFNPALSIFKEVLSDANFPESALNRVKQQTLASIRQENQDPAQIAANLFYQKLYAGYPYSHPVLGTLQIVPTITQNQAQSFYQRFFVSSNAKIILVGNIDRKAAEQIAEQLMSALPKGSPAPTLAMVNKVPKLGSVQFDFPSQQTTIITGQLGINRENQLFFPLSVGNYLLGQMPLQSLLFQEIRNQRGLAYDASSSFVLMSYRGPFIVILQTRTAKKEESINVTHQLLQQFVVKGPSEQQLQIAKQNIITHFPINLATNDQIANALTQIAINQRPLNFLDTYCDNVNAVTSAEIKQAFNSTLNPDNLLTITIGPKT